MSERLNKLRERAGDQYEAGRWSEALDSYGEILRSAPEDLTSRLRLGDVCRALGDEAGAVQAFREAAEAYANEGLLLKAISAFRRVLSVAPGDALAERRLNEIQVQKYGAYQGGSPAVDDDPLLDFDIDVVDEDEGPSKLREIPLFADLPPEAFGVLSRRMRIRDFSPGADLVRQGEPAHSFFVVVHGEVEVARQVRGRTHHLALVGEGGVVGEMALLAGTPRTATVRAKSKVEAFEIDQGLLDELAQADPNVSRALRKFRAQRLLANVLRTSPFLRDLPPLARRDVLKQATPWEVQAGEAPLWRERATVPAFCLLLDGTVRCAPRREGDVGITAEVGDLVDPLALTGDEAYPYALTAGRRCTFLVLPEAQAERLRRRYPEFEAAAGQCVPRCLPEA